jgi:hypothetical protein
MKKSTFAVWRPAYPVWTTCWAGSFEKSPTQLLSKALYEMINSGQVGVIDTRSLDLSIDETLHELTVMITRMQAKRIVIDSLSGSPTLGPTLVRPIDESR